MRRAALFAVFFAVLVPALCGAAHAAEPVRRVALVPAAEPPEYTVTLRSAVQFVVPLSGVVLRLDSRQMTRSFTAAMQRRNDRPGRHLTTRVAERLRAAGYEVTVLEGITRPARDPDGIDPATLAFDADIALQLRIYEIGYHSGFGSTAYVPKVNTGALSFTARGASYPYENEVYYGADAKPGRDWAIVAPESAGVPTFEALTADLEAVDARYRAALDLIAERIVAQFMAVSPPAK